MNFLNTSQFCLSPPNQKFDFHLEIEMRNESHCIKGFLRNFYTRGEREIKKNSVPHNREAPTRHKTRQNDGYNED